MKRADELLRKVLTDYGHMLPASLRSNIEEHFIEIGSDAPWALLDEKARAGWREMLKNTYNELHRVAGTKYSLSPMQAMAVLIFKEEPLEHRVVGAVLYVRSTRPLRIGFKITDDDWEINDAPGEDPWRMNVS